MMHGLSKLYMKIILIEKLGRFHHQSITDDWATMNGCPPRGSPVP